MHYGVSSTIRYHMESDPFSFPTFSLCSVNPFNSRYSMNLLDLANVDKYWRMFMEIESYLTSTRGHPMTLEEKYHLTEYTHDSSDTVLYSGLEHRPRISLTSKSFTRSTLIVWCIILTKA